ncbi:MAG: protein phosphatase 2C domain-containing protein [Smithella sp.]
MKCKGNTISHSDSHRGLVPQNNEDFILVDDELGAYLLADGMGGHNAGEVASELAVKTVHTYLKKQLLSSEYNKIPGILSNSIKAAHKAVNKQAKKDLRLMGMGTTMVELIIRNDKAFVCHIGDSRAYYFKKVLQRLTKDHTMGNRLLENNIPRHRIPENQWSILTQAIGVGDPPVADLKQIDISLDDILMLCSDGLTDMLTDKEIETIIKREELNIDKIAKNLIESANINGGEDNISVVLVKINSILQEES